MRSVHQHAKQVAMRLLPKSKRQLAHRIAQQRVVVLKAKKRRKEADNTKERLLATRDLLAEAKKLRRMVKGAEKAGRVTSIETISAPQARARKVTVLSALRQTGAAMQRIRKSHRKAKPSMRRQLALQYTMLQARQRFLLRRLQLLQKNKDFEQAPRLHPTQVSIQRVRLQAPGLFEVPKAGELIVLTRLIAADLTRNPGEHDKMFRARLRAYVKRATVRFLHKKRSMGDNDALVNAAAETLQVDAPAIEAEAEAGGFVSDPVADTVDSVLQPIADEIDSVVVDMQPEVEEGDVDEDEVDSILAEAETVESDLASAPAELQDQLGESLLPEAESPSRVGSRVDAFASSGEDEAPAPPSEGGESTLPPPPPLTALPSVPAGVEVQAMLAELDAAADAAFDEAGIDTDLVFQSAESRASKLDQALRDRTEGKVTLKKAVIGGLFVVGVVYLLTRRS